GCLGLEGSGPDDFLLSGQGTGAGGGQSVGGRHSSASSHPVPFGTVVCNNRFGSRLGCFDRLEVFLVGGQVPESSTGSNSKESCFPRGEFVLRPKEVQHRVRARAACPLRLSHRLVLRYVVSPSVSGRGPAVQA